MKNPPMPGCSGLYGPRKSRTTPEPKSGYPSHPAEVEHIPFFETPQEPKMLRALNKNALDGSARYNRFPPLHHVQTLFIFEIEFRFTFLGQKSQKVDLKIPFSFSKDSNIFNDLLAGASEHKSDRFFFVFKFL